MDLWWSFMWGLVLSKCEGESCDLSGKIKHKTQEDYTQQAQNYARALSQKKILPVPTDRELLIKRATQQVKQVLKFVFHVTVFIITKTCI